MPDRNRSATVGRKRKPQLPLISIHLPLEMTQTAVGQKGVGFFRNRLLWLGFSLTCCLDLLNSFAFLFPHLPSLPMKYDLHTHFTSRPFNPMGNVPVQWNPYVIGLAFPIPLDLLFSCWFLFLVWKAQYLFGAIIGINTPKLSFSRPTGSRGLFGDCNRGTVASPETFCSSDPKCGRIE